MIISVNWLKQFTDIDVTTSELATLIGARLVELEEVVELSEKYKDVIIVEVVECSKMEDSDHLNVTKINDGGVVEGAERDENGLIQVVCGALNVRSGMLAAWLPPRATVPESFNDSEPFVLSARKLRGRMSNGMLASAKELDLFEDHDGILEIDTAVAPGTLFADVYGLNDQLLDIENKSLTHRPDTFGIIGFAREVAAIQGKAFETPEWLTAAPNYGEIAGDIETPAVTIDTPELSARYQAVVLAGADGSAKSPLEIQTYLSRVGVRPISAIVDVTNYLMMVTGQPLHAFDYDKLIALNNGKADIHVRAGKIGETLELLDGRTVELSDNDIVIANGETAVALAGAMGGSSTQIDDSTKNIILESATFNLYNLRNTQMRHGIFSEAITRFTKGQPAELTAPVLAAAVKLLQESAGAKRVSDVADVISQPASHEPIEVTVERINHTLGSKFSVSDIVDTLQNVEFTVAVNDDNTVVAAIAPYWRADIHIAEDLIEEIGRLNGFDSIEPTLPLRDFTPVSPTDFDTFRKQLRQILVRSGSNEVVTYSFVHGDILENANQKKEDSYRITNSISPALQYYRQTITPSLLQLIHPNIKSGFNDVALFELNKAHNKIHGLNEEGVPGELDFLALTIAHKSKQKQAAYYEAKRYMTSLANMVGIRQLSFEPLHENPGFPVTAPFEFRRSSLVTDSQSGEFIGIVGEYTNSVKKAFKLPDSAAGFEIDPHALLSASRKQEALYTPAARYPSAERDVCYQVSDETTYAAIYAAATSGLVEGVNISVEPLDIYKNDSEATKNITLRYILSPQDKTLQADEVASIIESINSAVKTATSAVIV
ncbi:phenylalanine--tRNA ligase subunit beta [Candidatus Saccharibacteria bacterium]|nr:phenylalanine--tRNA ligase subunit beta [Candidatus Saccharibacteria bacterium]